MENRARFARTGFYASVISLAVFALCEWMRPGFVSRSFSFNWLIAAVVVFALWRLSEEESLPSKASKIQRLFPLLPAILFGFLGGMLVWNLGEGFGALRPLLALAGAAMPFLFVTLMRE